MLTVFNINMNLFIFLLTCGYVFCQDFQMPSATDESSADAPMIVGGEVENTDAANTMVYILATTEKQPRQTYQCGGTLLNEYNCLTAAHCIYQMYLTRIRIGTKGANSGGKEYISKRSELVCHDQYKPPSLSYDIGIIKVTRGMDLRDSDSVAVVSLAPHNYDMVTGTDCRILGWGLTTHREEINRNITSIDLLFIVVPLIAQTICEKIYGYRMYDGNFCAGVIEGGKGSCQGDSGGPAFDKDGVQVGIVSFGRVCAGKNAPGVYTSVSRFYCWIQTTMLLPIGISVPIVCDVVDTIDKKP